MTRVDPPARRRGGALCAALALSSALACGDSAGSASETETSAASATEASAASEAETSAASETSAETETSAPEPATIEIPATDATLATAFTFDVVGEGSARVGGVMVEGGVGTIELMGAATSLVVYEHQPWPSMGLELFQALAVTDERIYVVWFYCAGATLQHLWTEGTDGAPLEYEVATGACSYSETPSAAAVTLPAISMPLPALEPGFTLSGPAVEYDGTSPGVVRLADVEYTLLPFERVDCTDCGEPGWWELHALLWDERGARLCFVIVYLWADDPEHALLTYSLTLPELSDPAGYALLSATWTAP